MILNRLDPDELASLQRFHSATKWTTVEDFPNTVVSGPLNREEAKKLENRLNEVFLAFLKSQASSHLGADFPHSAYLCKLASEQYCVIFRRDKIPLYEESAQTGGKRKALIANFSIKKPRSSSITRLCRHPVLALNEKPTDPALVKKSLDLQQTRAEAELAINSPTRLPPDNARQTLYSYDRSNLANYRYGGRTLPKIGIGLSRGRKTLQQDGFAATVLEVKIKNKKYFFPIYAVFDGHSQSTNIAWGGECVNIAMKKLPEILLAKLTEEWNQPSKDKDTILFSAFKRAFVETSREIYAAIRSKQQNAVCECGTTATLILMAHDELWTAWVGDSGAMIADPQGKVIPLTWSHFPNEETFSKENRSVENRGGKITGNWCGFLGLTRSLGHTEIYQEEDAQMSPGINPRCKITLNSWSSKKRSHSHLIVATKGFWNAVSQKEAASLVQTFSREGKTCLQMAKELNEKAFKNGSGDNITVMVVQLPKKPLSKKLPQQS